MGPFEMIVAVVIVGTIGSVLRAKYGARDKGLDLPSLPGDPADAAENARLREELRALRERVQVLERVVTETEGSVRLDREIEALRERR